MTWFAKQKPQQKPIFAVVFFNYRDHFGILSVDRKLNNQQL